MKSDDQSKNLPKEQVSVYLDMPSSTYRFSDGIIMPLEKYSEYVESELNGEYPTEPRETSEAIFRARAKWESDSE